MKKLFTLLILCSTFSFGQYISKAKIISNQTNNTFEIRDVSYINDGKGIQFKTDLSKNTFAIVRLKDFKLIFDNEDYSKNIPQIKGVFNQKEFSYPDGLYLTKDDFISKKTEDRLFEMKLNLYADLFEQSADLVNFYDKNGKFPEYQQRDYFAIVKNGDIYFNVKEIKKIAKEKKILLAKEIPNFAYVRVKAGSDHHLYMELPRSQQNNGYLMMFGMAGAIASTMINTTDSKEEYSENYINLVKEGIITLNPNDYKGIIFNTKNKEFEILSNCSDLSNYSTRYNNSMLNLDCKSHYSIDKQREILNNL